MENGFMCPRPPGSQAVPDASASGNERAAPPVSQAAARWPNVGILLLLAIAGIAYARLFLVPVVLAFLLALVFSPVRRFLSRHGVPSGLSAFFIVGTLLMMVVASLLVLAEPVTEWIENAPRIGQQIEERVKSLRGSVETVVEAGEQVSAITSGIPDENVQEVVVREAGVAATLATVAPAVLAQVVFMLVLLLFLLSSGDMFYEKIVHVLPSFEDKKRAIRIAFEIERKLSRYLFTITVINAGLGLAIWLAMWLIEMPNPLLFGVIGFAFNFIPYFGALAGVVTATVVGLLSFDEIGQAALAGATYFALTSIEGQLITPYFVGKRLKLNTVAVFLSVAFWAWLWSVIGMLVAVPLLVTIRVFCEHIPHLQGLGDFLSARGAEAEEDSGAMSGEPPGRS